MDIDTIEHFINDTYIDSDEDEISYDTDIHLQLLEHLQGMIMIERWKDVENDHVSNDETYPVQNDDVLSRMYQCQREILDRLNMMDVDYSNRVMPDDIDEIIKDIKAHPLYHIFCEKIQTESYCVKVSKDTCEDRSRNVWKLLYHE